MTKASFLSGKSKTATKATPKPKAATAKAPAATEHYTESEVSTTPKTGAVITPEMKEKAARLVDIQAQLKSMGANALLAEYEEVKKELAAEVAVLPTTKAINIPTPDGSIVKFSAPRNSTEIVDKEGVRGLLGEEVFNSIYKLGLTDVRKYATDLAIAEFTESKIGARTMKIE